jgi:hypothetical protein
MLIVLIGCRKSADPGQVSQGPAGGPRGGFQPGGPPSGGGDSKIKQIMGTLTKGPNSLTSVIGRELEASPPAWETIQPQASEYARLAGQMGQLDPPKGSKESWAKLTSAYAGSAAALDKAAQAKDLDEAKGAHKRIQNSCMECHREHRGGPGFGIGPGGPQGVPPRGGPPQGPGDGDNKP